MMPTRVSQRRLVALVAASVCMLCQLAGASHSAAAVGHSTPVVETECGPVAGTVVNSTTFPAVASFKGIPYAAPPVGDLRWAAPMPPVGAGTCWNGTLNASTFGSYCVQFNRIEPPRQARSTAGPDDDHAPPPVPPVDGSEDCLFLNVWSPLRTLLNVSSNTSTPIPVMVFLHGGDLTLGASNDWDLALLSGLGNVVAVSLNYRLGLQGFLATKELSSVDPRGVSGNYGFLDMQLALAWVQNNVARFGGDPDRVTLFGQSSGGTAILALMASPSSKGLFHRAISLSGSPNVTMDLAAGEQANAGVTKGSGCAGSNASQVVACMRNMTPSSLLPLTPDSWGVGLGAGFALPTSTGGLGLAGIALVDGVTIATSPLESFSRKKPIMDVPLIINVMAQEVDLNPGSVVVNQSATEFATTLQNAYTDAGFTNAAKFAADVLDLYSVYAKVNAQMTYDTIVSDTGATCGNLALARAAGQNFHSPVYAGYAVNQPSHPFPGFRPEYECRFSFHGWDLLAAGRMWDAFQPMTHLPPFVPQAEDMLFGDAVRSHWVDLAVDGQLRADSGWRPVNTSFGWPLNATVGVTNVNTVSVDGLKELTCAFWNEAGFNQSFWWSD